MSSVANPNEAFTRFMESVCKDMAAEAEPAIREALAGIEKQMRRRVAEAVMARVSYQYDAMNARDDLIIRVNLGALTK